ncbi:unnamed protein product [Leptidea sinapis]|uniref:Uncharacterized protein n=1 Tax=Leptidea sinapis TaxID=189913 RepID=A0A5E4PUS8_9NEOP|nr:unnamed protein product [Leptidea sinapis]
MAKVKKRVQKQNARGQLRANFLKTVIALKGKQCNVLTCEDSKLQGTFEALKPRGTRVVLSDVITPANQIMSAAIIKHGDTLNYQNLRLDEV